MSKYAFLRTVVVTCSLLPCAAPLFGQATFATATSATTAATVGVTELTGQINLTVVSGTTVAAPLSIQYSAQITNRSALEIQIYGTGGLLAIGPHPIIDAASNSLRINVPAGGSTGSQIRILGVRVAVAGLEDDRVTANITSLTADGNAILVGQNRLTVIDRFLAPFEVDLSSSIKLEIINGVPTNPSTAFLIKETYPYGFTDSLGYYGQTVVTRFRIRPFPSIPKGVRLTFGSIAASTSTLAFFTTPSGQPETVPRLDGSTDVLYEFKSALDSPIVTESFRVFVNVDVTEDAGSGTITFQATLEPIGIAVPDQTYPSTDIPRYLELTLPDEADLITGTVHLAFPFRASADATYTGIAITNPLPYRVKATLTAYDTRGLVITGPEITNPVSLILPRSGQYAKLATEIFGAGFNADTPGTVRLVANTSVLAGFYLQGRDSGPGLDGATAEVNPKHIFLLPVVFRENPSPATILEFFNPGAVSAQATLDLVDSTGATVASSSQTLLPGGAAFRDLRELFPGIDPVAVSGGYVAGKSNEPLVVRETFGNSLDFSVLPERAPIQRRRFYAAHFASGGGYQTELNFINRDTAIAASMTITALDGSGTAFPVPGNPAKLTIGPKAQSIRTVADLFPNLGSDLQTGYISVDVDPIGTGYFTSIPPLGGSVRFSAASGYGSSALPIELSPSTDLVYSHVAQALGYYTGVALLNTNASAASITIEVYREDGTSTGSLSTFLQPGQKISKLLHELVPASLGQLGGYIRIRSNLPITSFSLFGTDDGLSLSAIPPQNVAQ